MVPTLSNHRKRDNIARRAVIACAILFAVAIALPAFGQSMVKSASPAQARPAVMAKIYKRPLLRPGRLQYCLKEQGLYDGRLNGRLTAGTLRALRKFRDDLQLKADDVAQDWALHAVLWRSCRTAWSTAGGRLDRFGIGFGIASVPPARVPHVAKPSTLEPVAPSAPTDAEPARVQRPPALIADPQSACLPQDLRDILGRSAGARPDVAKCELPCLSLPTDLDREDAAAYERRLGFTWCKSCVPFGGQLGLDDIARIEKAGNLTLCPDARRLMKWKPDRTGLVMGDVLRGTRAIFRRDVRPSELHNAIAVVVSISSYANGLPRRPIAERDSASVQALLVERLGFRSNRVIELKDPARSELDGVFGRIGNPKGLLADRLKDAGAGSPVFVYVSALGAISGEDGEAYLLPADAVHRRERSTGYPIEALYQNLSRLGAGHVTVVLEVDFSSNPSAPIVTPNAPETRVSVLPKLAIRNLTVFTASERDQRPLDDVETGLSLFTRHLVAGLSGHADSPPFGNGDGTVDSAEAFVYAAQRTAYAARKLSGVLQRPMISQGKALAIGRIGAPSK